MRKILEKKLVLKCYKFLHVLGKPSISAVVIVEKSAIRYMKRRIPSKNLEMDYSYLKPLLDHSEKSLAW